MAKVTIREMADLINELMGLEGNEWFNALEEPFKIKWGNNEVIIPITPETYEVMEMAMNGMVEAMEDYE